MIHFRRGAYFVAVASWHIRERWNGISRNDEIIGLRRRNERRRKKGNSMKRQLSGKSGQFQKKVSGKIDFAINTGNTVKRQ
jgi:hypothetical protein